MPRGSLAAGSSAGDWRGASSSSVGDGVGTPRSRGGSVLDRLRAGLSPSSLKSAMMRQSTADLLSPRGASASDARFSVATGSATDLQSVLSMSGQVGELAAGGAGRAGGGAR